LFDNPRHFKQLSPTVHGDKLNTYRWYTVVLLFLITKYVVDFALTLTQTTRAIGTCFINLMIDS